MYQGAYVKKRRKSRVRMNRATVLLMAILMLIGVVAGSTVAYLIDKTGQVANTFEYAKVSCEIKPQKAMCRSKTPARPTHTSGRPMS